MLYIEHKASEKGTGTGVVKYICKFCAHVEEFNKKEPKLISRNVFNNKSMNILQQINDQKKINIDHDVTLPHVKNIDCVNNSNCKRKKGEENDVIVIRYNDADVKYMYYCMYCKEYFKINS